MQSSKASSVAGQPGRQRRMPTMHRRVSRLSTTVGQWILAITSGTFSNRSINPR